MGGIGIVMSVSLKLTLGLDLKGVGVVALGGMEESLPAMRLSKF